MTYPYVTHQYQGKYWEYIGEGELVEQTSPLFETPEEVLEWLKEQESFRKVV